MRMVVFLASVLLALSVASATPETLSHYIPRALGESWAALALLCACAAGALYAVTQ